MKPTLATLRSAAVAQTLFPRATLPAALEQLRYVQADPIRAPARAQDLILFQRVKGYRAGDLDRRYAELEIEEDHFINYGFLHRSVVALMHPRVARRKWSRATERRAAELLEFVSARDAVHPREVDAHFQHGKVINAWGGTSSATTHLLDDLHYRGHLRVVRRERGIRLYGLGHTRLKARGAPLPPELALDALIDVAARQCAPLPASTLTTLVSRTRYCAPQFARLRAKALHRAKQRFASARVEGTDWFWPEGMSLETEAPQTVRLLAPFDPVVWDRRRVELLWNWTYRFEAYTPVARRKLGYYALPLLFGDVLVGWGNLSLDAGGLHAQLGYLAGRPPRGAAFRRALDEELERFRAFLAS